jgi:hypothetical protein
MTLSPILKRYPILYYCLLHLTPFMHILDVLIKKKIKSFFLSFASIIEIES